MTYRELIEICNKTPDEECLDCKCSYEKECKVFKDTVGEYPGFFFKALNIDFDKEIEV